MSWWWLSCLVEFPPWEGCFRNGWKNSSWLLSRILLGTFKMTCSFSFELQGTDLVLPGVCCLQYRSNQRFPPGSLLTTMAKWESTLASRMWSEGDSQCPFFPRQSGCEGRYWTCVAWRSVVGATSTCRIICRRFGRPIKQWTKTYELGYVYEIMLLDFSLY